MEGSTQFYILSLTMIIFALLGYHIPKKNISNRGPWPIRKRSMSDNLQNIMLGGILGTVNGYLLVGTLWYYLDYYCYPVSEALLIPPEPGTPAGNIALKTVQLLPPVWLVDSVLYIAVAIVFIFFIIVLI